MACDTRDLRKSRTEKLKQKIIDTDTLIQLYEGLRTKLQDQNEIIRMFEVSKTHAVKEAVAQAEAKAEMLVARLAEAHSASQRACSSTTEAQRRICDLEAVARRQRNAASMAQHELSKVRSQLGSARAAAPNTEASAVPQDDIALATFQQQVEMLQQQIEMLTSQLRRAEQQQWAANEVSLADASKDAELQSASRAGRVEAQAGELKAEKERARQGQAKLKETYAERVMEEGCRQEQKQEQWYRVLGEKQKQLEEEQQRAAEAAKRKARDHQLLHEQRKLLAEQRQQLARLQQLHHEEQQRAQHFEYEALTLKAVTQAASERLHAAEERTQPASQTAKATEKMAGREANAHIAAEASRWRGWLAQPEKNARRASACIAETDAATAIAGVDRASAGGFFYDSVNYSGRPSNAKRQRRSGASNGERPSAVVSARGERDSLLPRETVRHAVGGSVQQLLAALEGEFCRHVYSACALSARRRSHCAPPVSLTIELSSCGGAAADALAGVLCVRGGDFLHEFLLRLGARIVGEDRGSPLAPAALQRTVLYCHVFGRCCRARGESQRVRVLAFELCRYRRVLEPALLAALGCAWSAPLQATPLADGPGFDGAPTAAPGLAETVALLTHQQHLKPAAASSETESELHSRACALLRQHCGAGWAVPEQGLAEPEALLVCGLLGGAQSASRGHMHESTCALELLSAARGWAWTMSVLIERHLLPLLQPADSTIVDPPCVHSTSSSSILRLFGRLGAISPRVASPGVVWLRSQLMNVLQGFDAARCVGEAQVTSACALLEMTLMEGEPRANEAATRAATVEVVTRWLDEGQEASRWGGISPRLIEKLDYVNECIKMSC